MTDSLSQLDHQMLRNIGCRWRIQGYGPTLREIGGRHSCSVAAYIVRKLRRLRLVDFVDGVGRSLRLTSAGWDEANLRRPCCDHEEGLDKSPVKA